MRHLIKRMAICAAILTTLITGSHQAYADGGDEEADGDGQEQPIVKKEKEIPTTRPRKPSNQVIYFRYNSIYGICRFTLPEGIGGVSVTIESEEGDTYFSYVPAENPVWPLFLETGEYLVACDADNGSHFEGYVWID